MTIGVIGVSGFIGQYFTRMALQEGNSIIGWDIVEPKRDFMTDRFQFCLWNMDTPLPAEDLKKCDGVVNLAAKRPCGKFVIQDYFYNIDIAVKVIESCRESGIKNVVTISSRSVYSDERLPWKEEQSNIPVNLYGAAKAAVDDIVKLYNIQYDMCIKSLRLAQVLGLGERKGYLLNTFIDRAAKKETLEIWGTGEGKRQYIYVKDVVSAIMAALGSQSGGIYNIGMPGSISTRELEKLINHVFDNEGNFRIYKDKKEDLSNKEMDVTKAKRDLGWEASYTMETALNDIKKTICEGSNEQGYRQ